jgi:hypothetical protein
MFNSPPAKSGKFLGGKSAHRKYHGNSRFKPNEFRHHLIAFEDYEGTAMPFHQQYNHQLVGHRFRNSKPLQRHKYSYSKPQPRSFEELQAERSYLVSSLQLEDHKVTELLKNITSLQENLFQDDRPAHRHGKKTLGWMKQQLCETTRQEKTILSRLGQVTHEIQERERLTKIECEKRHEQYCVSIGKIQLDATTPEFQPCGTGYFSNFSPKPQPYYSSGCGWPIHEFAAELPGSGSSYMYEDFAQSPSCGDAPKASHVRPASMFEFGQPAVKEKRRSMPALPSDWETEKDDENDHRYVGYYVSEIVK